MLVSAGRGSQDFTFWIDTPAGASYHGQKARIVRQDLNLYPQPFEGCTLALSYLRVLGCSAPSSKALGFRKAVRPICQKAGNRLVTAVAQQLGRSLWISGADSAEQFLNKFTILRIVCQVYIMCITCSGG